MSRAIEPPADDDDIRAVLEARLGRQANIRFFVPVPDAPLSAVLATGERLAATEFLMYWVKSGPPRIFGLDGFSKPVAVFNERVVEIWADFRAIFTDTRLSEKPKREKIEQIILRTMAEIALTIGDDPSLPAQLAMAAAERCPGLIFIPNEIDTLEYEERGLGYMNCWFFAFAHELGHFQPPWLPDDWHDVAQNSLIEGIERSDVASKSARDDIIAKIRARQTGPLLDTTQIVTEALADAFAMSVLFESALQVMDKAGLADQFSISGFYHEAILSLNIVATFARIEQTILARRRGVADRQTVLEQAFYTEVINARAHVAFSAFRLYMEATFSNADVARTDRQIEILAKTVRNFERDIVAWDRGLSAAMKALFGLRLPCDTTHFLDRLNALPKGSLELSEFVRFAKVAGKSSWFIRALEKKIANPQAHVGVEDVGFGESNGSLYLLPTLEGVGQYPLPVCLEFGQDFVCFVFNIDTKEIFDDFLTLMTKIVGDQTRIISTLLTVRGGDEGVHDQIGLWLRPQNIRPQVLIQGSDAFHQHYLRLLNLTADEFRKIRVCMGRAPR
jgi:hypothetical protein